MFKRRTYKVKTSSIEVPDISILTSNIRNIKYLDIPDSARAQAICSFLYLSACRRNEVCRNKITDNPVFLIKNIQEIKKGWLIKNIRTLKRKDYKLRVIPIPDNKNERELMGYIQEYIKGKDSEEQFYPYTTQTLYRDVTNSLWIRPHLLRHFRLSHLVSEYNFTEQQLVAITNWTTSAPASVYVHVLVKDLINKMVGANNRN